MSAHSLSGARYRKQWQLDRESGRPSRLVPVGPVVAHLRVLMGAGWSKRGIAAVGGVSPTLVCRVLLGRSATMRRPVAERLLAIDAMAILGREDPEGFVPAIGARRRVRGLLALGLTHETMHDRSGVTTAVLLHQAGEWISRAKHDKVLALYEDLSMTPGPSAATRARAATLGYAPPLAWDDDTIDSPDAQPSGAVAS